MMKKGISVLGLNGKSVLLLPFIYLGQMITGQSVRVFTLSTPSSTSSGRNNNDKNNKLREAIIGAMINKCVPGGYYKTQHWNRLKQAVEGFLRQCAIFDGAGESSGYSMVKCINTAGRGHNYDFLLIFTANDGTTREYKVEFKFNASKISDLPQFVQLTKPSEYLSESYEEFFYDNYLQTIVNAAQFTTATPSREEWLKQVQQDKPKCMLLYKEKYKSNSQFSEMCKKVSAESICQFITEQDLNIDKLTKRLLETQSGKTYMFFKPPPITKSMNTGATITIYQTTTDDFTIVSCSKNPKMSRYECIMQSGKKMNVLLRWKNGNGIANPAFQIGFVK